MDPNESTTIQHVNEWLDEHGQPDIKKVFDWAEQASQGSVESRDTLRELAERYDIPLTENPDWHDIAQRIQSKMNDPESTIGDIQ